MNRISILKETPASRLITSGQLTGKRDPERMLLAHYAGKKSDLLTILELFTLVCGIFFDLLTIILTDMSSGPKAQTHELLLLQRAQSRLVIEAVKIVSKSKKLPPEDAEIRKSSANRFLPAKRTVTDEVFAKEARPTLVFAVALPSATMTCMKVSFDNAFIAAATAGRWF